MGSIEVRIKLTNRSSFNGAYKVPKLLPMLLSTCYLLGSIE